MVKYKKKVTIGGNELTDWTNLPSTNDFVDMHTTPIGDIITSLETTSDGLVVECFQCPAQVSQQSCSSSDANSSTNKKRRLEEGPSYNFFLEFTRISTSSLKVSEEDLQDIWVQKINSWRTSTDSTLKELFNGAIDSREPNKQPCFLHPVEDTSILTQTAKIDISSAHVPMYIEFKRQDKDQNLFDALQQTISRIHSTVYTNVLIKKAFGFGINGDDFSYFVVFDRQEADLRSNDKCYFHDNLKIFKVETKYVPGLWKAITTKALADIKYFLHKDASIVAKTLMTTHECNLFAYTKINLIARSSSRVYGVFNMINYNNRSIGVDVSKGPLYTIKVNDNDEYGLKEYQALHAIEQTLSTQEKSLFYVYSAIQFTASSVSSVVYNEAPRMDLSSETFQRKYSLQEELLLKRAVGPSMKMAHLWWERALKEFDQVITSSTVCVVLMKLGIKLPKALAPQLVGASATFWLKRINTRVFHTSETYD